MVLAGTAAPKPKPPLPYSLPPLLQELYQNAIPPALSISRQGPAMWLMMALNSLYSPGWPPVWDQNNRFFNCFCLLVCLLSWATNTLSCTLNGCWLHLCIVHLFCSVFNEWINLDCLFVPECPAGAASPCSGRGICDEGMEGTGRCSCQVSSESCSIPAILLPASYLLICLNHSPTLREVSKSSSVNTLSVSCATKWPLTLAFTGKAWGKIHRTTLSEDIKWGRV